MIPAQPTSWIIDRFENGQAVLKSNGKELRIARSQISGKVREGDIVTAEFYLLKDEPKRKADLAKALLEEILGKS